jgi:hypothetical protein
VSGSENRLEESQTSGESVGNGVEARAQRRDRVLGSIRAVRDVSDEAATPSR